MHIILFIVFLSFNFFEIGYGISTKDIHYIGCFPTAPVKDNDYYEIRHMLTWEECVMFCRHRLTRYAAVQIEKRPSSDNFCFCGNDLAEKLSSANSLNCSPCTDDDSRYCGGDEVASLYQLRDFTPFAVFMATDEGVQMFVEGNSLPMTLIKYNGVTSVKYLYSEDEIFFLSGYKIYRSFYNYFSKNYDQPTKLILHGYLMLDFVIDWGENTILWMNGNVDYSLYEANLQGENVTKIVQRNYSLKNMAIDPYYRELFFVEYENKLYSYALSSNQLHKYHDGKFHMHKIKAISIDVHEELIYVIGTVDDNNQLFLVSLDYQDSKMRVLFSGPQLTDPTSFDVYGDVVAWVNRRDNGYILYKCHLTPRCQPDNVTLVYQSLKKVQDIKIFHPEMQTPGTKYLCRRMNCSHGCIKETLFSAQCTCPPGMTLRSDSTTCQGKSPAVQVPIPKPPTTTPIFDNPEAFPEKGSSYENTMFDNSERSLRKIHLDEGEIGINRDQSVNELKSDVLEKADSWEKESVLNNFELFVTFCFLTIFTLLIAVIYLQLRRNKNVQVGHNCRAADLDDTANTYVEIFNISSKNGLISS